MKKYITTAIPYANAKPHIGHAMDYLLADVWARYQKQQGNEVRFSAGLDEHGTKVEQKAAENNVSPQEFVDDLAPSFREMIVAMNIGVTDYVRTTDTDHVRRVQDIWKRLDDAGMIYRGKYEGWYCVGHEQFFTETEAGEMDYFCKDHQKPLEKISEENYYLKVSDFTDQIREFAKNNIVPNYRGKEILELIKDGAQDVSISRPAEKLSWGIPVPGDDSQVMYVWVDALSNYITVLGYPDKDIADWWPADVEVVGKDILRFHAIIWPAILLGLGLDLPKKLLVHGFINIDGTKMSKSLGNVIAPNEIIENYGVDALRYYFLRHISTFDDGDFTWGKFEAAYNGELADNLGNLVSRVANMIKKYCDGKIDHRPFEERVGITNHEPSFKDRFGFRWDNQYGQDMNSYKFDTAMDLVFNHYLSEANTKIEEFKPWKVYKDAFEAGLEGDDINSVYDFLNTEVRTLLYVADLLTPFLPETAAKIQEIFGGEKMPDEIPILFPKKFLHTEEPKRK